MLFKRGSRQNDKGMPFQRRCESFERLKKPVVRSCSRDLFKRSVRFMLPTWRMQIANLVLTAVITFLWVANPWIQKLFIDHVIEGSSIRFLVIAALALIGAAIARIAFSALHGIVSARIKERILLDIRMSLADRLTSKNTLTSRKHDSGEVVSVFFQDVETMGELYGDTFIQLLTDTLLLVAVTVAMLALDRALSAITITALIVLAFTARNATKPFERASEVRQKALADGSSAIGDYWRSLTEARLLGAQSLVRNAVKSSLELVRRTKVRFATIVSLVSLVQAATWLITGLILVYGGMKIIAGEMTMGSVLAFWSYMGLALRPINTFLNFTGTVRSSLGAARRVFEITDSGEEENLDKGLAFPETLESVRLDNLGFCYEPGKHILKSVSLTLAPGEKIGLVGPSGSGKSTIAGVISRLFTAAEGTVQINGVSLDAYSIRSLRANTGVVQQDPHIFIASAFDNIRMAKLDASRDEVVEAAMKAQALEFIEALPDGFDTILGEGSRSISGGEKQRIALARLFLRNPKIIILDEATSAIDQATAEKIMDRLFKEFHDRTMIVITHHFGALSRVDRVYSVREGALVELTKEEAMAEAIMTEESQLLPAGS